MSRSRDPIGTCARALRSATRHGESGQSIPVIALSLGLLLVVLALVVDGSRAFVERRALQNVADSSALAAAQDFSATCTDSSCTTLGNDATTWSTDNGGPTLHQCANAADTNCYFAPYVDPQGITHQGQVEVRLHTCPSALLGGILNIACIGMSAHAVAAVSAGKPPPYSFVALDPTNDNHTLIVRASGQLNVTNDVYVNSTSGGDGFDIFGPGGNIVAPKIQTQGGWETHNGDTVTVNGTLCPGSGDSNPPDAGCPETNQPLLPDPFAGKVIPPKVSGTSAACEPGPATYTTSTYSPNETLAGSIDASQTTVDVGSTAIQAGETIQIENERMLVIGATPSAGGGEVLDVVRGVDGTTAAAHTEPSFTVTGKARNNNVATLTTSSPHGLAVGDTVSVSGVDSTFDGTFTVTKVPSSTTFQYASTGDNLPPYISVTQKQLTSNVATLTTSVPHGFSVGDSVYIKGVGGPFADGAYTVTAVPTPTTFQFALVHGDVAPAAANGTVGYSVTATQLTSNVATITTGSPHHLSVGDAVTLTGVNAPYAGTYTVTAVPTSTTFQFALVHGNVAPAAAKGAAWGEPVTGTVTGPELTVYQVTDVSAGAPGNPQPCEIPAGDHQPVTLDPGTYYGGICIGAPQGSDCTGGNCIGGDAFSPAQTLGNDMTATQTTVTVSGTAIKNGDYIEIDSEVMHVTGGGGTKTLTVDRGQKQTTAVVHAAGAAVTKVPSNSSPDVTLQPGTYVMAGGGFWVCGSGSVSAPNVLIYNTQDPSSPTGYGALDQVELNTTGSVEIGPQTSGPYAGLSIWEDSNLALDASTSCDTKSKDSQNAGLGQWDVALLSTASTGANGELGSISGTIYEPAYRAYFADRISGTANLAVLTSCIFIDGGDSTFAFDTSSHGLFGVGEALAG